MASQVFVPEYLDHIHSKDLYEILGRLTSDEIEIRFDQCKWAEHSELHKLAVVLGDAARSGLRLIICVPRPDLHSVHPPLDDSRGRTVGDRAGDVFRYACRMGFLSFLFQQAEGNVAVLVGDNLCTSEDHVYASLGETQGHLNESLHLYHPYIPMQTISDQHSVERTSDMFSTGEHIEELLNHYTELDFIRSGELSILIVNELVQNVVEHAWTSQDGVRGSGAISLNVVRLGSPEGPKSRHSVRLMYGPQYERTWIQAVNAGGYLELCVSDSGIGIPASLAALPIGWAEWFPGRVDPPPFNELLAAAFWADVTRDAGPHRPGHRGLYFVFEFLREYHGAVCCQSGGFELWVVASGDRWKQEYLTRDPLKPTETSDTHPWTSACKGTHFRLLLPLSGRRQRSFWQLSPASPVDLVQLEGPIRCPTITTAPRAPSSEALEVDRKAAMTLFRDNCRRAILSSDSPVDQERKCIFWASASRTRNWRKQHIQMLLDEMSKAENLLYAFIVNVPAAQFRTFLFLARHSLPIESGRVVCLLDEAGRLGLVYRDYDPIYDRFMQWARDRVRLTTSFKAEDRLLMQLAATLEDSFEPLTLHDVLFAAMRQGIAAEFADVIEDYRDVKSIVKIHPDVYVRRYVELDEALRDTAYVRALVSFFRVALRYAVKPAGLIVVRRAAERLVQSFEDPERRHVWTMSMPRVELLPPAAWLEGREMLCILTDVITTGRQVAPLIAELHQRASAGPAATRIVVLCPLVTTLRSESGHNYQPLLRDSKMPGVSTLFVQDTGEIPLMWVHRADVDVVDYTDGRALVPDPATNIIFDETRGFRTRNSDISDVTAPEFCRLAEGQRAIWLGHVSITGDHFDLEFDMPKLLRTGSRVLEQFAVSVAKAIKRDKIDCIVYPDDSRIDLAIPRIEDAFIELGEQLPHKIRLRRSSGGALFWRSKDAEAFAKAQHALLLDDAINSGGTVRQMLESAAMVGSGLKSMLLYVLVSRQAQEHEELLGSITSVVNKPFSYRRFVHFPVSFFNEADCPLCLRQRLATVLAVSSGPGSAAATAMQELAEVLRPAVMYGGPSFTRPHEPTGRYSVPVWSETHYKFERFATLSGAKACLAVSVSRLRGIDARTVVSFLQNIGGNVLLWTYALYCLASRQTAGGTFWLDENFRIAFADQCQRLSKELQHRLPLDPSDPIADAAVEIVMATWFAPDEALPWALAKLVGECDGLLSYESIRNQLFLLAFRFATLKGRTFPSNASATDALRAAVATAQKRLSQSATPQRVLSLDGIERLIRLRQVLQIAEGEMLKEPWLEGLVYLLSRLSYKGGHEFVSYINRRDLAEADRLRDAVEGLLNGGTINPVLISANDSDHVFSEISRFLGSSRNDLSYLASALAPVLSNWFRALELAGFLPSGFRSMEPLIVAAQEAAKDLLRAVSDLGVAFREREIAQAMRVLPLVVAAQRRAYEAIYVRTDQEPARSLRYHIESNLCPLYDLALRLSRSRINAVFQSKPSLRLTGSFFDYVDTVERQSEFGEKAARWSVLLVPTGLAEEILLDVIAVNPDKHVISDLAPNTDVEVRVSLDGFDSLDQKISVRTEVFINARAKTLPGHIWRKTLGRQRIRLSVYGGDIRVVGGHSGEQSVVLVEFRSGHF
jgi:hypothetical protein